MSRLSALSRRKFLLKSAAASFTALTLPSLRAQQSGAAVQPRLPLRDTNLKFNQDGHAIRFMGNTVICHLPAQCAMRDQMALLHEALATSPFHDALGLTSVPSYHMTVFSGANDQDRQVTGWPSYVPIDAPIFVCNQMVQERMAKITLHCELPLRVRLDQQATLNFTTAATLRMVPADPTEAAKLRSVREQLAEAYGFRSKNHDSYQFHITMSYQVRAFSPAESAAYRTLLREYLPKIIAAAPILELSSPEYCTFEDMQRFEPRLLLRSS